MLESRLQPVRYHSSGQEFSDRLKPGLQLNCKLASATGSVLAGLQIIPAPEALPANNPSLRVPQHHRARIGTPRRIRPPSIAT